MGPSSEHTESLLAQAGWVRRLAHHLVRDPERAEDLVQDTWVAALGHPPRTHGSAASTRAFLGRVLRNAWLQGARSERHRRKREEANARSAEAAETHGAGLVEEVDSQRMLMEEVLRLSEPARTTVLLRYFRGMSAAEIARSQGVPPATVRSRLARALSELRGRLDARHGGSRSAWALGVLAWARATPTTAPLPHSPPPPLPAPLGAAAVLQGIVAMKATKLVLLAGLAGIAAFGVSRLQRSPAAPLPSVAAEEGPRVDRTEPTPPPPHEELEVTAGAPREEHHTAPASAPRVAPEPAAPVPVPRTTRVSAVFVDEAGLSVPGVAFRCVRLVGHEGGERRTTLSAASGLAWLEVPVSGPDAFAVFDWSAEGYQLGGLQAHLADPGPTDLGTITLAGGTPVSGRVLDLAGRPLAGARVWAGPAEIPEGDPGQIERRGPATVTEGVWEDDTTPTVPTDEDGRFRIPGVASGPARVWAHAEGMRYSPSTPFDVVPGHEVQGIEVVLRPLAPDDRIEGIVLSARGIPVPRAQVEFAVHDRDFGVTSSIRAGEDGRFRLVVWRKVPHTFTVHAEDGSGVAHAARVEPGTLDLVLRIGVADSYELVVTDPDGEPIESYQVETRVGTESSWTGRVEAGAEHPGGSMHLGLPEAAFWLEVRAVGYGLGTLGPFEPESVPPRVELVLEPAQALRGRVYAEGTPCAGVRVELYRALDPMARLEVNGFPAFWQVTPEAAVSAADGTFQLMPRGAGEYLVRAEKEGWAPGESRPLHLAEGAGAKGIDVHLGHGGTLVVQVVAAPGEDPAGVIVAVTRGDSHPRTLRADATGRAVFEGLMPGTWDVHSTDEELEPFTTTSSGWEAEAGAPAPEEPRDVDVFEGRTTRYVLELAAHDD